MSVTNAPHNTTGRTYAGADDTGLGGPGTNTVANAKGPGYGAGTGNGAGPGYGGGTGHGYGDDYGYAQQPGFPAYNRRIGNPAPLGLYSFATTTLLLGLYTVNTRGVQSSNAIVGMALVVGGLTQILAGMWEYAIGNTFAATAFSTYGGFFFSIGICYIPGSNATAGYNNFEQLQDAFAIYLIVWFIFGFCLWLGTFRSSFTVSAIYFFMWLALLLAMSGLFVGGHRVVKAGGAMAIVSAAIAYYVATSNLVHDTFRPSLLPVFGLGRGRGAGTGTTTGPGSTTKGTAGTHNGNSAIV